MARDNRVVVRPQSIKTVNKSKGNNGFCPRLGFQPCLSRPIRLQPKGNFERT